MSNRNYLSCAETAKLVRQALKESFPGVKFSVKSSVYSMGASIRVRWTDGPTGNQVDEVLSAFEGAYFDGMIDYKGSRNHLLDGQPVHFGANFVNGERDYTDALIAEGIAAVAAAYGGCEPFTVEQYHNGSLWQWKQSGGCNLQRALNGWFAGKSDFSFLVPNQGMAPQPSATLARVQFEGDDGYGQGTVGMPGSRGGSQCYVAQNEARERARNAEKIASIAPVAIMMVPAVLQ